LVGSPTTIVKLGNVAATCFKLGVLSKELKDYPKAVDYFCQEEDWCWNCVEHAENANEKDLQQQSASSSSNSEVFLVQLIVKTLQGQCPLALQVSTMKQSDVTKKKSCMF
jgi:hypothetical protein